MIWKEEDLIDILKRDGSICKNYENNSYFFDLQKEIKLECIVLKLEGCDFDLEKIQYSIDNKNFKYFDKKYLKLQENIVMLILSEEISIRYLKMSLSRILDFKLFIRRHRGLFIASAPGGYGDRFIALLNAIYLSQKLGFKYGLAWRAAKHYGDRSIESEDYIFSKEYLEKHSYTKQPNIEFGIGSIPKCSHINEIPDKPFKENFGYYVDHANLTWRIKDISKTYLLEYPQLWNSIGFSKHIQNIIKRSRDIFLAKFSSSVICIHVRSGDIVYGDSRDIHFLCHEKATPVEIALEIIERNINSNILIAGEDEDVIFKLIEYIKNKYHKMNIWNLKSLVPCDIKNRTDLDFFELIFMSNCKEIYSYSGFARLASMIGNGVEPKRWVDIFTHDEKISIINKNNFINSSPYQKAYSLFVIFYYAKLLKKDIKTLTNILVKAFEYDRENQLFILLLSECYIKDNAYEKAEDMIFKNYSTRLPLILRLYKNNWYFNLDIDMEPILNFPYLCSFFAIKCYYKGDFGKFLYCISNSNILTNQFFIDFLNNTYGLINNFNQTESRSPFQTHHNTAKTRIQNQLSYKLGQAMILGEALIKANKTWYKGGYVKLMFEIGRLKREFLK